MFMTEENNAKLETKVDIKVKAKAVILKSITLKTIRDAHFISGATARRLRFPKPIYLFPSEDDEDSGHDQFVVDQFVVRCLMLEQDDDEDELMFHEGPIEIEATITIGKKGNMALVPTDFVDDFKSIGTDTETSDVTVTCNGKVFPCHKNILCARSAVLHHILLGNSH